MKYLAKAEPFPGIKRVVPYQNGNMTCDSTNENLDDFIDGTLEAADMAAISEHIAGCANCQTIVADAQKLQDLLQEYGDTDVPNTDAAFFDQTLLRAARSGARVQRQSSWLKGFGSAIAAGFALWVIGAMFFYTPEVPDEAFPSITMALEEPRTVNFVFSSATDLIDATLTVMLPEGIETAGFEGQREISWKTSLSTGKNVLPLELIATSPLGGEIFATLRHEDDDRSFRLQVNVI